MIMADRHSFPSDAVEHLIVTINHVIKQAPIMATKGISKLFQPACHQMHEWSEFQPNIFPSGLLPLGCGIRFLA